MKVLRQTLVLLALAQLAACFLPDVAGGPTNQCAGDADCTTGVCNVELGMCVSDATSEPLRIGLRVIPEGAPFGAAPLEVSFPPALIDGPETRNLTLPVSVPVSGLVRDNLDGQSIGAHLILRAASPIPGQPPIVLDPEVGEDRNEGGYQFNLSTFVLPSTEYTFEVLPTGESASALPPWRPAQSWMSPLPGEAAQLPPELIVYPNRCGSERRDCLATFEGIILDGEGVAQDGYVVRAIETASGLVVSSTAVTGDRGGEPGRFSAVMDVRYLNDPTSFFIRITPSVDRTASLGPQPSFTVEASSLFEDTVVPIRTPNVASSIVYEGFVESESDGRTLEGATLEFESSDIADASTEIVGVFRSTATTDAEGRFSVELLPGTYDVVVIPDGFMSSELGVLREAVDLTSAAGSETRGQLFQVPARQNLAGSVRTSDGLQMTNTQVIATVRTERGLELFGPVSASARSNLTMTDAGGRFSLPLDVGVYDITILPRAGSNYPRRVETDVEIGGGETPLGDRYDLSNPMTVSGVASFDADGALVPVPGGRIEAYAVVGEGDDERSVLVAEAMIDAEGHYTLLLPPSI